jgi:HD-GYP domain-containing protein (c-di-GMP phosphodiesterase class II)
MPWRRSPTAATFRALAQAVDYKAGYVPGHSDGVAYLVGMMAREAGYDEYTTSRLELAALIHDVGKVRIPDSILLAERKLTEEEFAIIKRHPIWSANVAAAFNEMEDIVPWVRHHHEHWDGSGYPDGLKGNEIPWPSRMLLVADAFHVMTTDRPYQRSRTRREALVILSENAHTQFCPAATSLLLSRGVWIPADPPLSNPPEFNG